MRKCAVATMVAASLGSAAFLAACNSGAGVVHASPTHKKPSVGSTTSDGKPSSSTTTTTLAPTTTTTTTTSPPTSGAPRPSATIPGPTTSTTAPANPGIGVQTNGTAVLVTLHNNFSNLSSRIQNAHFSSSQSFTFEVAGVIPPGEAGTTTYPGTGGISQVVVTFGSSNLQVTVQLSSPMTTDSIGTAGGFEVQASFS